MKVELFPHDSGRPDYIRIDAYDTFGMDSTLASLVVPMLRRIKNNKQGVPWGFIPDDGDYGPQGVFAFIDKSKEFDESRVRWATVLDKMIWSFERLATQGWDPIDMPVKGANHLGASRAHRERIQEGIDLFAKYYGSLWD